MNIQLNTGVKLEKIGSYIIRYGLVLILLWIGGLKFTQYEAMGVYMIASASPFFSWLTGMMSAKSFSALLGSVEILLAILIAIKNVAPKVSAVGSIGAIIMFLITLSFLLSTPGVWQPDYGFPFLSPNPGQFLIKDIMFLGAAVFTAGESIKAYMWR